MYRKTGHLLGKIAGAGSVGVSAYIVIEAESMLTPLWIVAAVLTVVAIYMHEKLYLADPAAMEEYTSKVRSQQLGRSFKNFGVENMLRMIDKKELREKIAEEVGMDRLALWIEQFSSTHLVELVRLNVLTQDEVKTAFTFEAKLHKTFSSFWFALLGELPRLHRRMPAVVDAKKCVQLLAAEYDWLDTTGELCASAPADDDAESPLPGGSVGVYRAVVDYQEFCQDALGLSRKYFLTIVETCAFSQSNALPDLVEMGLLDLGRAKLVSTAFVTRKLNEFISVSGAVANLWMLEGRISLKHFLELDLVDPIAVQRQFNDAIPLVPMIGFPTKENNVVLFLEYWRSVFERHGSVLIPIHLQYPLRDAYRAYEALLNDMRADVAKQRDTTPNMISVSGEQKRDAQSRTHNTFVASYRTATGPVGGCTPM